MNRYFKSLAVGLLAATGLVTTSCDLEYKPIDSFSASNFWGTKVEFEGYINALSQQFRNNYPSNILFYAGELRAGVMENSTIDGSGILNPTVIQNTYSVDQPQFTNFGGYYGYIANINELIYRCNNTDVLTDNVKNGLLAMAYGYRAYAYFQMYRMYGGVVLRTEPDVVLGEYEASKLYKGRSTAEQTLQLIKDDVKKSLELFGQSDYVFNSANKDYYWSKAASEMLAGEVYLWSGKVETDDHKANPADVVTAATYFENVINNYGYSLMKDYFSVWTTPHNSESIFSVCYTSENDGVYYSYPAYYLLWARVTGSAYESYWSTHDKNGFGHVKGCANAFGRWTDPATDNVQDIDIWAQCNFGPMRYTYKNSLFYQYDEDDSRVDMFYPQYRMTDQEWDDYMLYLPDFDPHELDANNEPVHPLAGTFVCKFKPTIPNGSTYYQFLNDQPIYRLALAYMYAAECANYAGDNPTVKKYIDLVRERAYGDNWDEEKYGYTPGTFAENENAIMREKDKEFVMEGQRWWDLRRLTTVKGGTQENHFVFQPQGCLGYGLDTAENPWMVDINGDLIETDVPVLNKETQAHMVLWPLDRTLLNSDPELAKQQNPGY